MERRVKNYKLKFHQALPVKFFPMKGKGILRENREVCP